VENGLGGRRDVLEWHALSVHWESGQDGDMNRDVLCCGIMLVYLSKKSFTGSLNAYSSLLSGISALSSDMQVLCKSIRRAQSARFVASYTGFGGRKRPNARMN
jgi:hypothetical protein